MLLQAHDAKAGARRSNVRAARRGGGGGAGTSAVGPAVRCTVEALEGRRLLSLDAAGWTVLTPSSDSHLLYVDNTPGGIGRDTNPGTQAAPLFSFAKAASLVRPNSPDWILLKRGTVHNRAVANWNTSGRSLSEPVVITSYGPASAARPRFVTGGASAGFSTETREARLLAGAKVRNVVLRGLEFTPGSADTLQLERKGFLSVGATESVLVEDCVFRGYQDNVTLLDGYGSVRNFTLRRSVIADAYQVNSSAPGQEFDNRTQGLFAKRVEGLVLEENLFDHNGWNESVAGAGPNMFSQSIYIQRDCTGVRVERNIIANSAAHGLQARSGGIVRDNLFLDNPFAMLFGYVNGAVTPNGVSGEVSGNVVLGSRDVPWDEGEWALDVGNTRPGGGTVVRNNVIRGDTFGNQPAIRLRPAENNPNPNEEVGLNDVTIEGNTVYGWPYGIGTDPQFVPGATGQFGLNNVTVRNNTFQRTLYAPVVNHAHTYDAAEEFWSGNRYDAVNPDGTTSAAAWFSHAGAPLTVDGWKAAVEPTAQAVRVAYVDPNRSAASYNLTLGGTATQQAFLAAARAQSRQNWRPQYAAMPVIEYVRAGFVTADPSAPVVARAEADAYVRDGVYAAQNFGQAAVLEVKKVGAPGYSREGYVRFDLSQFASASEIGSAKVRLFGRLLNTAAASVNVGLCPVANTAWSESGLTWNTRPAAGATAVGTSTVTGTTGQWYEFDVTSYLKQQKSAGATAASFALKAAAAGDGWAGFSSDEAASNRPELVVTRQAASAVGTVTGLTLINAATDAAIGPFTNGATLELGAPGAPGYNVRAETDGNIGSVVFALDGSVARTESFPPYTVGGDAGSDYLPWDVPAGAHTLTATPYAGANGTGTAGQPVTVSFTVTDSGTTVPLVLRSPADAYVRDGAYAGQNFGQGAVMEVKRVGARGYSRESYVTFDLAGVGAAADVASAKLRLFGRMLNTAAPSVSVGLYPVASVGWTESALTWNTRPASGAAPLATATVSGTAGRWYEFDVTAYVRQQSAAGATAVAFALKGTQAVEGWAGFTSDEAAADQPQLVVTAART